MVRSQRNAVAESRRPALPISVMAPSRRPLSLLVAATMALLATACGMGNGDKTLCSTYMSMDSSDQRSTIATMYQQDGDSTPSSDQVSEGQRSASTYCANPYPNIDTIDGMFASRAP
jgi:hypothetical protein